MAAPDAELEEYRQLMLPPDEYKGGFNAKTILGVFFITIEVSFGHTYTYQIFSGRH